MTTIHATIPDFLARLATDVAEREHTTMDQIIAVALASQLGAWQARDSMEQRARRGAVEDLDEILAAVPDAPPSPGDER